MTNARKPVRKIRSLRSTMAKKQKSSAAPTSAPAASAVTAKADIDDIFAKPSAPVPQSAMTVDQTFKSTSVETTKNKKKKKTKAPAEEVDEALPTKPTKRKAADTTQPESADQDTPVPQVAVFSDPSATSTKKQKTAVPGKGKSKEQMQQEDEEERAFRDSRGDGPRKSKLLFKVVSMCQCFKCMEGNPCEKRSNRRRRGRQANNES